VEDLRLRCADATVEAVTARERVAPLAAWVKELEEELIRVAGERDAFRSRAGEATTLGKVLAGQLGAEQSAHQLTKGTLDEALMVAEASRTEAVIWRGNAEGESCSLYLIRFSCVRPLTPWCDTELAGEASRAAEATRVEAQHLKELAEVSRVEAQCWKEKAKASQVEARRWGQKAAGEFCRLSALALACTFLRSTLFRCVWCRARERSHPGSRGLRRSAGGA